MVKDRLRWACGVAGGIPALDPLRMLARLVSVRFVYRVEPHVGFRSMCVVFPIFVGLIGWCSARWCACRCQHLVCVCD